MIAVVAGTNLTTPDTTRSYTVTVGPHDLTGDVQWDSLQIEDQGASTQATTSFRVNGSLASFPGIRDQQYVEVEDHIAGGIAFRGFVDSRRPAREPTWNQIEVTASDHTSLLDNVIPLETRPAGESDRARIGYLWGKYATGFLAADLTYVQQISASLPAQIFSGVTLRQAIDQIAAQASASAFHYLDRAGRLHYGASETNNAPKNVTSDTPGAGEIAPLDLNIDYDSKSYIGGVYVRGKTEAGSGWVYSESAKSTHNGLVRTAFFDAPDCTTAAMRNALGAMYLGRVGAAIPRGTFSTTSRSADGWRAGQNVTVRSSHLNSLNQSFRIARVGTSVMGPLGTRPAGLRRYAIEFGGARAGTSTGGPGPTVGQSIVGDFFDDGGNLLLGSGSSSATGGFGAAVRRYITSGVYNGDFALTPPYPDSSIVEAWNPLPFWTFTQASGVAITAQSAEDSSVGSGRVLQFTMAADGSAADDSYFEQLVPINGSRGQSFTYTAGLTARTGPTVSAAKFYIIAQYLKGDGVTTTGTAQTSAVTTTSTGANTVRDLGAAANDNLLPSDAYYLRVRIGFKRDAAATSTTETITISEVRLDHGNQFLAVVDGDAPGTYGPFGTYQASGVAFLSANQRTGAPGFGTQLLFSSQVGSFILRPRGGGGAGELAIAGASTVENGVAFWDVSRKLWQMGDGSRARGIMPVGWALYAFPEGGGPLQTPTTARNLPVSGGSLMIPITVPTHMKLYNVTIWNTDTASARAAEWRLYELRTGESVTGDEIPNANGTWSFTPSAASNQGSDAQTPPVYIGPGVYVLVIRNTSGAQTFGVGQQASGTMGPTFVKSKTLAAALGATLDLNTSWTGATEIPGVILRGTFPGATGYF